MLSAYHILKPYLLGEYQISQSRSVDSRPGLPSRQAVAQALNIPLAFIEKRRIDNKEHTQALNLIGDVNGRDVLLIDDEIDTGGSIVQAVQVAKLNGARDVYVVFIHPVLSSNASERLSALPVKQFITTNTIPMSPEQQAFFGDRLTIISIGPLLAEVIKRANEGSSVGAMFNE